MIDYSIFFYFWLHWALLLCVDFSHGVRGLLPSCSVQASHGGGLSYCGAWAQGAQTLVAVVQGLSCPVACGIFLDQGSNQCPWHR